MKSFLLNSKNIERDSYVWNMLGSLFAAFQSVILLIILTHSVDLATAGIFTLANSNAGMFLTVGRFGMRNYQVSDVKYEYSFRAYHQSRVITVILMVLSAAMYITYASVVNGYSIEKSLVMIWMTIFRVADAYEDVFYGEYQRKGRLDVAAKAWTLRIFSSIVVFALAVIISKNLLVSLEVTTIFSTVLLVYLLHITRKEMIGREAGENKQVGKLLSVCVPVFLSAFLAYYIGNAPKYAIDAKLTNELQAIYGFISMPVFVVVLLNNFVFNPILFSISCLWKENNTTQFIKAIVRQTVIVIGITVICVAFALWLGVPILSILYNTDLSNYKHELLWLMISGGLLGLSGVYTAVLTIMRCQCEMVYGYAFVAFTAFIGCPYVVEWWGMIGAVLMYNSLLLLLCVFFTLMIVINIKRRKEKCSMASIDA